jgi:hypothetical protein
MIHTPYIISKVESYNDCWMDLYLLIVMELTDQKVWELSKMLYNTFQQEEQERKLDTDNLA